MKCKDCGVAVLEKCPHCFKEVVICDGNEVIVGFNWYIDKKDCDGIIES